MTEIKLPNGLSLLPFQVEAVEKMLTFLRSNKGCYNACEMGLGKSVQTIAALNTLLCKRILIICPAVMRSTWEREISKWSVFGPRTLVIETKDDFKGLAHCDVAIISYDLATKHIDKLDYNYDALVLDEAHHLKNLKAKRTRAILDFEKPGPWLNSTYHIALSGTPFTQSVIDGFTLFNAFDPDNFSNFWSFAGNYAFRRSTPWGTQYFGVKNAEVLSRKIRSKFYIRYRKDEVLKDLPPKTYVPIILEDKYRVTYTKEEKEAIATYKKLLKQSFSGASYRMPKAPESLAKSRREQGEKKVSAVVEFVKEILEQGIPVVLFAYHRSVIFKLLTELDEYKPGVIYGDTSAENRTLSIDRFQNGETNLFIGQMQAAGVGITLTRSSTAVLSELDWSPSIIAQSTDRLHRISQLNPVTVYYFQVKNSIDDDIVKTVIAKAQAFKQVLDEKEVA